MNSLVVPADLFGTPEMRWTETRRLRNMLSRMSQIVEGRWKVVADYPRH